MNHIWYGITSFCFLAVSALILSVGTDITMGSAVMLLLVVEAYVNGARLVTKIFYER